MVKFPVAPWENFRQVRTSPTGAGLLGGRVASHRISNQTPQTAPIGAVPKAFHERFRRNRIGEFRVTSQNRKRKPRFSGSPIQASCFQALMRISRITPVESTLTKDRLIRPFRIKHLRKSTTKIYRRLQMNAAKQPGQPGQSVAGLRREKSGKIPSNAENKNANPFVFSILAITGLFSRLYPRFRTPNPLKTPNLLTE